MRILLTGADRPLGQGLVRHLGADHEIEAYGESVVEGCSALDLRQREGVEEALASAAFEAVIHAMPFDPEPGTGPNAEQDLLDRVGRGTYVLATAALAAGVKRVVLASRLDLMAAYPADFVVHPVWLPQPRPEAGSLAPYMAELACREIARARQLSTVCLRLEAADDKAYAAVSQALEDEAPGRGHSWDVRHVGERN
jgi:nucleoside-diphosphate-sugar epimerase